MADARTNVRSISVDNPKAVKKLISKEQMDAYNKALYKSDEFLSNSLLTMANRISSPRENMFCQQLPQALMILNPDVPRVFTGYEHEVGRYSKSYLKADRHYTVVNKISKYPAHPNLEYMLILKDDNGNFDIVKRVEAVHLTESYGYMNNNEVIDSKNKGSHVAPGEVLYKSSSFDADMNFRIGKNVNFLSMAHPNVVEDSVWASQELVDSLQYPTIHDISTTLNQNELFLNYYGDQDRYKTHPDIGEHIKMGVLCAKRRINSKSMIYNLKDTNLRNIHHDEDDVFYSEGIVMGIEIFSNKPPEELNRNPVNAQIMYYYDIQQDYYRKIVQELRKIINNNTENKLSKELLHVYHRCNDLISGKPIVNNNSKFENLSIIFTVLCINKVKKGYKVTGRFGEKGVIGHISPRSEMPMNQFGEYADLVTSSTGILGRLNLGQWSEQELTFLADNVVRDLKTNNIPTPIGMPIILKFLGDINPDQAAALHQFYLNLKPEEQMMLYENILVQGLSINQPPFWGNAGFEELRVLYKKYPYQKYRITINGEKSNRRMIIGTKYIMLLKQTPLSKYSVRSLGMQSAIGHPSKSIKFKTRNIPYSNTPIRIGDMELYNLLIMNDSQAVADLLSIYANSIVNREEFIKTVLTVPDPRVIYFNPPERTGINRKMLNSLLKVCGVALVDTNEPTLG